MDIGKVLRFVRYHYPECFGIRKFMQRIKVKRIFRHTLSISDVIRCENDPTLKKEVIAPYLKKWHKYLVPVYYEMDTIFSKSPLFSDGKYDKDIVKTDMLFCRLAYGFIPSEYIGFDFFEKSPQERKKFCSDLYTNYFGYCVNNIVTVQKIIDKARSAEHFKKLFKRDILILDKKSDFEDFLNFTQKHPTFVKKKVFSSMGRGVERISIDEIPSLRDYFDSLVSDGKWLLEEVVKQSAYMSQLNTSSVNTVRCMTFRTTNGVAVPHCFMRTGRNGSFVDNGGSGGLLVGVDTKTGIVDTDGYDEYGVRFSEHPNTRIKFKDFKIPDWNDMINICKSAADEETQMGYLSWDMAHTDNGWVVIEVNAVGQFIGPQIVHKSGIKDELDEYMSNMEKAI